MSDFDGLARAEIAELRRKYEFQLKVQKELRSHTYEEGRESYDRLQVLEHNFSRLLLLVEGILEVGRKHGWLNEPELLQTCATIDALDGKTDGKLDPVMVPGMKTTPENKSLFSLFKRLEDTATPQPPADPTEFLKSLEQQG